MEFYVAPIMDYNLLPVIKSGKGCYIYDDHGKKYLDINCGQFSSVLGHSSEIVGRAVAKCQNTLVHLNTNLISENFLIAAKKLHDIMSEMNSRVLLLSTGSEAIECCLRYAKHLNNNKSGIISFSEGYHGLTHGAEGYSMGRKWVKPSLEYSFFVDAPQVMEDPKFDYKDSIAAFRRVAEEHCDIIAAALFEPIVSVGGLFYPPKEYWQEIRKICDETGIYLIFDECQTGFGRTGTWFYYQQLGCVPDMLVSAKAMGLGFPVSMVAFNGNKFKNDQFQMHHFSSHQNEPFSAELVLCAMQAIEENHLLNHNREMGIYLLKKLEDLAKNFPILIHPRGCGLLCGINLKDYGFAKKELLERQAVLEKIAYENGLLLQFCNNGKTIRILPSYIITTEDIDLFVKLLGNSLSILGERGYSIE